jgi:hypothetical protein
LDEDVMMKKLLMLLALLFAAPVYAATWTQCATGDQSPVQTCSFTGTRNVRYGTTTQYVTRKATGQIACDATTFGVNPHAGQTKVCKYSSVVTGLSGGGCGTGTANPSCIGTLPVRAGTVTLTSANNGQVFSGGHYTSTTGPCFVVNGAQNITIRDNEIGPCGSSTPTTQHTEGVQINGSTNITVQRNVIHDISTGVLADNGTTNPIILDRNFFYNIRGPFGNGNYQGQMTQFGNVAGGSSPSKITCNVSDDRYGGDRGITLVEDHISLFGGTQGVSVNSPIEIAYNKIRGIVHNVEAKQSGSGMMLGDTSNGPAGYYWIHDNIVVQTNGVGIGISGGTDIIVENNKVTNNGLCGANGNQYDATDCSETGWAYSAQNNGASCSAITFRNNFGQGKLWAYNHDGSVATTGGSPIFISGCTVTQTNNDSTTTLDPVATWNLTFSQCN